jgi:hypothetical protein
MRKTLLTVLGAAVVAAMTVQVAAASPHHGQRARSSMGGQYRNSNAYAAPTYVSPNFAVPGSTPFRQDDTPSYDDPSRLGGQARY